MASSRPHRPSASDRRSTRVSGRRWRIFAIDDDPVFLEVVRAGLDRLDCVVETTTDPRAGVNRVLEDDFDLVLLDLMMPGLDGDEVLSLLKPFGLGPRLVVVSGCDDEDARSRTRDLGAVGYVQKPLDIREFSAYIEELLLQERGDDTVRASRGGVVDGVVDFVFGEAERTPALVAGAFGILAAMGVLAVWLVFGTAE